MNIEHTASVVSLVNFAVKRRKNSIQLSLKHITVLSSAQNYIKLILQFGKF